jgi:hypothetical protein
MNIQENSRELRVRQYQQIKNRQQSMLMRAAQQLGLSQEISGYWNPTQGRIDSTLRVLYETSHASMS